MFEVSVITPVYNAATTVRRAVESAVGLDEVGEVILVDDAGPDEALAVCRQLEEEHAKVRLLRHPDHGNHGAGASRNLGIAHARFPFIAFLDADDYYLVNRFDRDREILTADPTIDGVYGATGIDYEDEAARERFHAAGYAYQEFTTLSGPVPPEELFAVFMNQHPSVTGAFTTDAVTVRSGVLKRIGGFEARLQLRQDTHLWCRLAAFGCLLPGSLDEAVAVRGVHGRNRMTDLELQRRMDSLWWSSLASEFRRLRLGSAKWRVFRRSRAWHTLEHGSRSEAARALAALVAGDYRVVFENYGIFDLVLNKVCDHRRAIHRLISLKNRVACRFQGNASPSQDRSRSGS